MVKDIQVTKDNRKNVFSLPEIAAWSENRKVSLPTIQRGFVWKPFQIENLWDSILRGYPLGAFVMTSNENQPLELLDGQQRSTAISLGFGNDTFRHSLVNYRVFIDLEKPDLNDSRKFIVRVITRSHPWGYSRQNNTATLSAEAIRNAMQHYDEDADPLTSDLEKFFPADAKFPVPLSFFINAASSNENIVGIYTKLSKWQHWDKIRSKWAENQNLSEEVQYKSVLEKLEVVFRAVKRAYEIQKIPALYLDLDEFAEDNTVPNDEAADEIETMFVRLNAGGTPLTGEELNYSILKAHISSDAQEKIEEACKSLFRPARFITIAYRLFQHEDKDSTKSDALTMRIQAKQFQRTIVKEKKAKEFQDFLLRIIEDKNYSGKTLLEYVLEVLRYESNQTYALPYLLYSKLSDVAPELMFLLLYRIKNKKDTFTADTREHRRMLGLVTLLLWFGRGTNLRDHSKVLLNIWPSAETESSSVFWGSKTIQRAQINDVLLPFPYLSGEQGIKSILNYNVTENLDIIQKFGASRNYIHFIARAFHNKDLLLYVQRHFLEQFFKTGQYHLEDTNLPFDWDHISANNLVRNKQRIQQAVKNCYQTIGNFRAWPFALNRMDSDNTPARKFRPFDKAYYGEPRLSHERIKWEKFANKNKHLVEDINKLNEKLLEWSFCGDGWAKCDDSKLAEKWRPIVGLIRARNVAILEEWYDKLMIDELLPVNKVSIDNLRKGKWSDVAAKGAVIDLTEFNVENETNWLSAKIDTAKGKVYFYLYYEKSENPANLLKKGGVKFGIYDMQGDVIKEVTNSENSYLDKSWIQQSFTLISHDESSYCDLVSQIRIWLQELDFPNEIQSALSEAFDKSISSKFNIKKV
ncbi:DUF262 domain-containing protein [Flavobacterium sp.]|uniref:DUF262 domain-containing protein n=1 Tax=Flavobacterium sp. TaxID=239 RepID=UPI0040347CCC